MHEGRDGAGTDADVGRWGGGRYSGGVVDENEFLVGVAGSDGEVKLGGELGGGDVELGDSERGDGEAGAVGAVEDVEDCTGDGGEDEYGEDDEGEPEAAGAAPAPAAALGLWAVGGAGGTVQLGFGGRKWVCSGATVEGLWWVCRGLRVYSVCHGCLIGACLGEGKWMFGGEEKGRIQSVWDVRK